MDKRSLGALFQIGSSKRVLKSEWKSEGVPFYRGREITRLATDGSVENELFISEEHFAQLSREFGAPKPGDIVLTAIGTIGNSYVVGDADRFYFKDASVLWMKRTADVCPEFVNLWLKSPSFFDQLDRGNGATVDTLTIGKLKNIEIPLPPLPEQRRIVGILDEAFEGIAAAKANAEKNLANARAVFESNLDSVFASAWGSSELVTLAELTEGITDGDHSPPPKASRGVPFVTIGNINKSRREIDFGDTFMVPRSYFDGLKPIKKPRAGDVLYTVTGSYGIPVHLKSNVEFCFQRHIGLIRPSETTDSAWLSYLLLSPQVVRQANDGATGTAQRTVSLGVLRNFVVPKVGPKEQAASVEKLDAVSDSTRRLESIFSQKLTALEDLKKSLLHSAFSGQL